MADNVNDLSEDDFDAQFNEMMSTPPESEREDEPVQEEEVEVVEEANTSDNTIEEEVEEIVDEDTEEVQPFSFGDLPMDEVLPFDVKASGSKMKVTLNELVQGFEKGINYTQKLQGVAGLRKVGNLMDEESLSMDDLNLLVELKKGNAKAASKLMGNANIDSMDIDADEAKDYTPNNYGTEPVSFEMESVRDAINADTENLPKVENALNTMPQPFFDEISGVPNSLNALYLDVKSGVYDQVMPEMQKLSTLNNVAPSVELYKQAANIVAGREQVNPEIVEPTVERAPNPVAEKARTDKRKSATSGTKRKSPAKAPSVNFDDLNEADFEKEFQKMTGRAVSDFG